jgi:hypothetical protein
VTYLIFYAFMSIQVDSSQALQTAGVVLFTRNSSAGLVLLLCERLAFLLGDHAIGFGGSFIGGDLVLLTLQTRLFPRCNCASGYALVDAVLLLHLALVNARGGRWVFDLRGGHLAKQGAQSDDGGGNEGGAAFHTVSSVVKLHKVKHAALQWFKVM